MKKVMPPFLKQPPPLPILPNPQTLPFYGKNLTPPPLLGGREWVPTKKSCERGWWWRWQHHPRFENINTGIPFDNK